MSTSLPILSSNSLFFNASLVGQWSTVHDWFYFISNIAVWSACIILPILMLIFLVKKGKDDYFFKKVYWLSALFLFVNGCTYFADALIFFNLAPEVTIIIRLITAAVSWIFLVSAIAALSKALSTKTRKELMEEIAKRMQMEYELKIKNERLLESERNVSLGYIFWDLLTNRVEVSEMAGKVLGIRSSNATTYDEIFEELNPEQTEVVSDFLHNKLLKSTHLTSYFRIVNADNEETYVLVKAEVLKNSIGDPVTVRGSIQDVSELRELQKMEEQKKKLKEIAWVQSHRMRSPVATILGMAELFNYENPSDPVNAEVLNNIKSLTQSLDKMIHEVDALTRVKEEAK